MIGDSDSPLQALIYVAALQLDPPEREAVAALWETAVGWGDYVGGQSAGRAEADRDPQAALLRDAVSPAMSHSDEEELRRRSDDAEPQLRSIVGSIGGLDLVATAMRLHRQERSLTHNPLLSPDEIFSKIAQLRATALRSLRAKQ